MKTAALALALMGPTLALAQAPPNTEPAADATAVQATEATEVSGPTTYALSPAQGRLYVLVRYKRGTLGSGFGHDHVVVASGWTGSVTWNADDLSQCRVSLDLPVSGLQVDPGDARSWEQLEGETDADDKQTIQENLRSDDQLDMSSFSTITYRSTRCVAGDGETVNVTGTLTVHGVGKALTVPMRVRQTAERFGAVGRFEATHSDFGMSPYSAAFGAVKNAETLSFIIDVTGTP